MLGYSKCAKLSGLTVHSVIYLGTRKGLTESNAHTSTEEKVISIGPGKTILGLVGRNRLSRLLGWDLCKPRCIR